VFVRFGCRKLAVGVEPVDAELDFGENASCGIQLAVSCDCRYHLRDVVKDPVGGAMGGEFRRPQTGEGCGLAVDFGYKTSRGSGRRGCGN
jgi:hypothetical protein